MIKAYKIYEIGWTIYNIEVSLDGRTANIDCVNLYECCRISQLLSDLGFEDLSEEE